MAAEFETTEEVQNRINEVFAANQRSLNGTDAEIAVQNFSNSIIGLNDLRMSLNAYKDSLDNNVTLFNAVNNVLIPTENEYYFERLGYTQLTSATTRESFDGGLTYVTTVTSLIGPNSINAISAFDDDTITGVLGNQPLLPITLLGVTSATPTSISDGFNKLTKATASAIGTNALNIVGGVTLNACTLSPNILGAEICAIPSSPSLVDAFNGIMACSTWVMNSTVYGITNTGSADDCNILSVEKALAGCISYL